MSKHHVLAPWPTSNHEDVLQGARLDRGHHLIRHPNHRGVPEADRQLLVRDHPTAWRSHLLRELQSLSTSHFSPLE